MTHYYEHMDLENVVTAPDKSQVKKTNKWSKLKHLTGVINWPGECASREFSLYKTY